MTLVCLCHFCGRLGWECGATGQAGCQQVVVAVTIAEAWGRGGDRAAAGGGVSVPDVVLAEVAWVLRGYDLDRVTRHALLERLVRTRCVVVDDIDAVIDALENFRQGGDPADQLILSRAAAAGA